MTYKKPYKRTFYRVDTKKYCGCIAVDQNGEVYKLDTAPCYKWMSGKKFSKMLNWLKYKKYLISCEKVGEEIDPF
jgi:uncharacterized Fe-S cluster-containing radical SAM superfamily protein